MGYLENPFGLEIKHLAVSEKGHGWIITDTGFGHYWPGENNKNILYYPQRPNNEVCSSLSTDICCCDVKFDTDNFCGVEKGNTTCRKPDSFCGILGECIQQSDLETEPQYSSCHYDVKNCVERKIWWDTSDNSDAFSKKIKGKKLLDDKTIRYIKEPGYTTHRLNTDIVINNKTLSLLYSYFDTYDIDGSSTGKVKKCNKNCDSCDIDSQNCIKSKTGKQLVPLKHKYIKSFNTCVNCTKYMCQSCDMHGKCTQCYNRSNLDQYLKLNVEEIRESPTEPSQFIDDINENVSSTGNDRN